MFKATHLYVEIIPCSSGEPVSTTTMIETNYLDCSDPLRSFVGPSCHNGFCFCVEQLEACCLPQDSCSNFEISFVKCVWVKSYCLFISFPPLFFLKYLLIWFMRSITIFFSFDICVGGAIFSMDALSIVTILLLVISFPNMLFFLFCGINLIILTHSLEGELFWKCCQYLTVFCSSVIFMFKVLLYYSFYLSNYLYFLLYRLINSLPIFFLAIIYYRTLQASSLTCSLDYENILFLWEVLWFHVRIWFILMVFFFCAWCTVLTTIVICCSISYSFDYLIDWLIC